MKQQNTHGIYDTIDQIITDGVARGLGHLSTQDEQMNGRTIRLEGEDVLNFATASYMSLERHPALIAGARDALERYGTQFAASRTYVSLGLYDELEGALQQMFGKPVLVAGSTTLGHLSAIPVLVSDEDAVVLDHQVHSSIQTVVQLLKARNVPLSLIRHNRMDQLESKIKKLRGKYRRIWYFADGIYSMFGDGAPLTELVELMNRYEQLVAYVDDAHGFGWAGEHGAGYVRSKIPHHPNLVLAVSLNKSFASAGGALVFPNEEMKRRVRTCGPTFIFCGPVQPPMLGAALAAAKLQLSDAWPAMQAELADRIRYCNEGLAARGLPQADKNETPLYFVPTGMPRPLYEVAHRLLEDRCCVNIGSFPAVPVSNGGVRFHMHRSLAYEDIDLLLDRLAEHWRAVLSEEGTTPKDLARWFRMPELADLDLSAPVADSAARADGLTTHEASTIDEVPAALWDAQFAGHGPMDHAALQLLEPAFARAEEPADIRYVWVTDGDDHVVLATFYCVSRMKEDMFSPTEVSEKVEAIRREENPDFLVTPAVSLGCPITLGRHLALDREHPAWKQALKRLVDVLLAAKEASEATRILLREFDADSDEALTAELLELGFIEASMPDMMRIDSLGWTDRDAFVAGMKSRYRYDVRREVLPFLDEVEVVPGSITDEAEVDAAYALYMRVQARGRRMNVLPLPRSVFAAMLGAETFDILRFVVDGKVAAVMISHVASGRYTALLVGFDEALRDSHAIYKVALFATVERAGELGATAVNLAYTAETVKKKVGARPHPTTAYVLIDDTFGAGVLQNL